MTSPLNLVERFGDAHARYLTPAGVVLDVVREGDTWKGYIHGAAQTLSEVVCESTEEAVLDQLDKLYC